MQVSHYLLEYCMSKALKEAGWRLVLPEIRNIVKEEVSSALAPVHVELKAINVRIDEMDKRLTGKIEETNERLTSKVDEMDKRLGTEIREMDKRLSNQILEMDKRLSSQINDLRESVNVAQRIAVLEAQVKELRKD